MRRHDRTLYEVFAVDPSCTHEELKAAYRDKARSLHPDMSGVDDGGRSMVELNEAWSVLGSPETRDSYDATIKVLKVRAVAQPSPPATGLSRRDAWVIGVQAQIGRLGLLAGKSATQTLLLRSPLGTREDYTVLVDLIVQDLVVDTHSRVRAARAAGAAPLDLGVAATLIGVRSLADGVRRQSSLGITNELTMTADLLDRMWDVLAHELPITLEAALGSNPHVARLLHS